MVWLRYRVSMVSTKPTNDSFLCSHGWNTHFDFMLALIRCSLLNSITLPAFNIQIREEETSANSYDAVMAFNMPVVRAQQWHSQRGRGDRAPGRNSAHPLAPKWNCILYRCLWRAAMLSSSQPPPPLTPEAPLPPLILKIRATPLGLKN